MKQHNEYSAPELRTLKIDTETIFCQSAEPWHKQGGQGNFTYGVEEDETWG